MSRETMGNYINFAKKNWYSKLVDVENPIRVITSKNFIEAIAKWKRQEAFDKNWCILVPMSELIEQITVSQAIAIRDDTLEEFINNILPNE